MRKLILALAFILPMLASGQHHMFSVLAGQSSGVFTGWTSSSLITTGLGDIGSASSPTVFELGGTTYMISGKSTGLYNGYSWNGSTWSTNSGIISGLPDAGTNSRPTAFWFNSTLYLIVGRSASTFLAYSWTGSAWTSNTSILTSLSGSTNGNNPFVFYFLENSTEAMCLVGWAEGVTYGEYYNTDTWYDEPALFNSTIDLGTNAAPSYFYYGEEQFYILGAASSTMYGYSDAANNGGVTSTVAVEGLTSTQTNRDPCPFYINGVLYLLIGNALGTFEGYVAN